jgi:hypothetical protein
MITFGKLLKQMPAPELFLKKDETFPHCLTGLEGCRLGLEWRIPIIFLDACAIKNKYRGVIMGATAFDGGRTWSHQSLPSAPF